MIAASFRRFTLGASVGRRKMYDFYNVPSPAVRGALVKGTIAEHTIDLRESNPGDIINVPYEFTVHGSFRDFWQSGMYSYDRICTSSPFARSLGMQDQILPFNLMLYLTGSMSHANHAKLQLGFRNAVYHWPGFQGDTFQKRFIIKSLKTTSCGKNSTVNITCEMVNQNNALVFACEKSMLFPFAVPPSQQQQEPRDVTLGGDSKNPFLDYLIDKAPLLQQRGSQSLSVVRPGQLILHTLARPMTATHMMQLATLARLTHDRHFNTHKYAPEELLVPGGLVLGLTCSLTARDLHECLYESLDECVFPNQLGPGDTVGALTYVRALQEHVGGDIEVVSVRTLGVKNLDVEAALRNKDLPTELFTKSLTELRHSPLEDLLRATGCAELSDRIVCIADRKLYRQAPQHPPFLL